MKKRLNLWFFVVLSAAFFASVTSVQSGPRGGQSRSKSRRGNYAKDVRAYARSHRISIPRRLSPTGAQLIVKKIVGKERRHAAKLDKRNSAKIVSKVNARFAAAQKMKPAKQRILYGFSHLVDQKLSVDQKVVNALFATVNKNKFSKFVARGPGKNGTWGRRGLIDDVSELAAAILTHERNGMGKAKQFSITSRLQKELQQNFQGLPIDSAPGGAGLFGANISGSFENVDVRFHSPQVPSTLQAKMFSDNVAIVTPETGPEGLPAQRVAEKNGATKINYAFETNPGETLDFAGEKVKTGPYHRIILSSQASYDPVFDTRLSKSQLKEIANANDIFVAVGLHYLTGLTPNRAQQRGATLRRQLKTMRESNPNLYVHYSYVVPRNNALEGQLFRQLHGLYDSIDLNSAELTQLARNLDGERLGNKKVRMPKLAQTNGYAENPTRIYTLAKALLEATDIDRVRIHARWFDLTLIRTDAKQPNGEKRMAREAKASLFARAVTTNKVANPSGVIAEAKDRWPVVASLPAKGFAEMRKVVDLVGRSRNLSEAAKDRVMTEGVLMAKQSGGVSIAITPAREFHDFSGGLISAGDTLALTALQAVGPAFLEARNAKTSAKTP